jgi:ketosteroid isomerase-like protein
LPPVLFENFENHVIGLWLEEGLSMTEQNAGTMKKLLVVIPLAFLFCFSFSCQQGEKVAEGSKASVEADIQAIRAIAEKWEAAINAGDIDSIMSFYSDNAIKYPPNEPAVIGKEAIRIGYQKLFEEATPKEDHVVLDVNVNGALAFTNTTWSMTGKSKASGESIKGNGNWIRIFGKQPDRAWKVIYTMWSDESLVSPTQRGGA